MSFRSRQLSHGARSFVLVLCTLMLVIQPVFAAVGELHELTHNPAGGHVSLLRDAGVSRVGPDRRQNPATTHVLHALVEGAHCCGPGAAMAPLMQSVPFMSVADLRAQHVPARFVHRRLPAPFKPPIDA